MDILEPIRCAVKARGVQMPLAPIPKLKSHFHQTSIYKIISLFNMCKVVVRTRYFTCQKKKKKNRITEGSMQVFLEALLREKNILHPQDNVTIVEDPIWYHLPLPHAHHRPLRDMMICSSSSNSKSKSCGGQSSFHSRWEEEERIVTTTTRSSSDSNNGNDVQPRRPERQTSAKSLAASAESHDNGDLLLSQCSEWSDSGRY
jgi:hypothetical protein